MTRFRRTDMYSLKALEQGEFWMYAAIAKKTGIVTERAVPAQQSTQAR